MSVYGSIYFAVRWRTQQKNDFLHQVCFFIPTEINMQLA